MCLSRLQGGPAWVRSGELQLMIKTIFEQIVTTASIKTDDTTFDPPLHVNAMGVS
jgi:hypothetical protein